MIIINSILKIYVNIIKNQQFFVVRAKQNLKFKHVKWNRQDLCLAVQSPLEKCENSQNLERDLQK